MKQAVSIGLVPLLFSALVATGVSTAGTDEASELVKTIAPEVARLRGLPFRQDVKVKVVDDDQTREYMTRRLAMFGYDRSLDILEEVYGAMGLLDDGDGLMEALLAVLESQTVGYYDPPSKTYFLLADLPAGALSAVTAHELTHALEDQHFDMDSRLRSVLGDDDRLFARSAVHEGSATLLMSAYVSGGDSTAGPVPRLSNFDALPAVLRRQFIGPYLVGAGFLRHGGTGDRSYPKEAIDRVYRDPPASSEQILHPEKYWNPELRDAPVTVRTGKAGRRLGRRWRLIGEGVLGELTVALVVGAVDPSDPRRFQDGASWTHPAAAGWDGDRWELWRRGSKTAVLWITAWDSERDAAEFAEALPTDRGMRWKAAGNRVAVVIGADDDRVSRVLADMLK